MLEKPSVLIQGVERQACARINVSQAAHLVSVCVTAYTPHHDKQQRVRFEPGNFTFSDTELNVLQRIRELEDKLEVQKRHLKELEEKVSGVSSDHPLGFSP